MPQNSKNTKFDVHDLMHFVSDDCGLELIELEELYTHKQEGYDAFHPHFHSHYEIIWFFDSGGSHVVDFDENPVESNTLFFIAPGQVHSFDETPHKGYILKFTTDFLNEQATIEKPLLSYHFLSTFIRIPYFHISSEEQQRSIGNLFRAIRTELNRPFSYAHHEMLQSMMRIMLVYLERCVSVQDNFQINPTKTTHLHYIDFRLMVEHEFTRMHLVQDYADHMNVSTKYLTRCVTECAQDSPLSIINGRILLEARRLLRYSDLTIKEIAFRLGFEDPSYFVKLFKRICHQLPGEFRANRT